MKKNILLSAILLSPIFIFGQVDAPLYELTESKNEFKIPKEWRINIVCDYGNDGFLGIQENSQEVPYFSLYKYSPDFERQVANIPKIGLDIYNPDPGAKDYNFKFYQFKNKKYFLFKNSTDKLKTGVKYFAYDFTKPQFNFNDISPISFLKGYTTKVPRLQYMSEDSTKLLAVYHIEEKTNDVKSKKKDAVVSNTKKLGYLVLDENLNKLYEKEVLLTNVRQRPKTDWYGNYTYGISNTGAFYVIGECFYNDENKKLSIDGKTNFYYNILVFEKDKDFPSEITINLENYFVDYTESVKWINNADGSMSIAFICNKNNDFSNRGGFVEKGPSSICYIPLKFEKKITYKISDYVFDIPQSERLKYDGTQSKVSGHLELLNFIGMPDGSSRIVLEERNDKKSLLFNESMINWTTTINNDFYMEKGSFYVMKVGSDHKLKWTTKIPKRIHRGSNLFSSLESLDYYYDGHYCLKNGNNLDIIYCGSPKNIGLDTKQFPDGNTTFVNNYFMASRVTSDGKLFSSTFGDQFKDYPEIPIDDDGKVFGGNKIIFQQKLTFDGPNRKYKYFTVKRLK